MSESHLSSSNNGSAFNHPRIQSSLLPDIANVGNFSPITSDTGNSEDSSVFSQEKFQEARKKVEKQLDLDKLNTLTKPYNYIRRHHF